MCSNFIIPLSLSLAHCILFIYLTNLWRVALINHMLKTLYSLTLSFCFASMDISRVSVVRRKFEQKKSFCIIGYSSIAGSLVSIFAPNSYVCVCASKMMCLYSLSLHDIVYNTTKEASIFMSYFFVFLPHPSHYLGSVKNRFTINHSKVDFTLLLTLSSV